MAPVIFVHNTIQNNRFYQECSGIVRLQYFLSPRAPHVVAYNTMVNNSINLGRTDHKQTGGALRFEVPADSQIRVQIHYNDLMNPALPYEISALNVDEQSNAFATNLDASYNFFGASLTTVLQARVRLFDALRHVRSPYVNMKAVLTEPAKSCLSKCFISHRNLACDFALLKTHFVLSLPKASGYIPSTTIVPTPPPETTTALASTTASPTAPSGPIGNRSLVVRFPSSSDGKVIPFTIPEWLFETDCGESVKSHGSLESFINFLNSCCDPRVPWVGTSL